MVYNEKKIPRTIEAYLVLFLLYGMWLYLASITYFSPVYVVLSVTVVLLLLVNILNKRITFVTKDSLWCLAILFLILPVSYTNLFSGQIVNLILGLVGYILIRQLRGTFREINLVSIFKRTVVFGLTLLTADSIYRILNPGAPTANFEHSLRAAESEFFYLYKYNSLMFADSNTTGIIAIIIIFSLLSVKIGSDYKVKGLLVWAILIVISTFSRAAYIALLMGMIYFFYKKESQFRYLKFLVAGVLIMAISVFVIEYLNSDTSGSTKMFVIVEGFNTYIKSGFWDKLFGHGVDSSKEILGMSSHNLLLNYLIELGLVSLLLFIGFLTSYAKKYGLVLLLPILVVSMSYFLYYGAPFLFYPMAVVANIKDLRKKVNYTF